MPRGGKPLNFRGLDLTEVGVQEAFRRLNDLPRELDLTKVAEDLSVGGDEFASSDPTASLGLDLGTGYFQTGIADLFDETPNRLGNDSDFRIPFFLMEEQRPNFLHANVQAGRKQSSIPESANRNEALKLDSSDGNSTGQAAPDLLRRQGIAAFEAKDFETAENLMLRAANGFAREAIAARNEGRIVDFFVRNAQCNYCLLKSIIARIELDGGLIWERYMDGTGNLRDLIIRLDEFTQPVEIAAIQTICGFMQRASATIVAIAREFNDDPQLAVRFYTEAKMLAEASLRILDRSGHDTETTRIIRERTTDILPVIEREVAELTPATSSGVANNGTVLDPDQLEQEIIRNVELVRYLDLPEGPGLSLFVRTVCRLWNGLDESQQNLILKGNGPLATETGIHPVVPNVLLGFFGAHGVVRVTYIFPQGNVDRILTPEEIEQRIELPDSMGAESVALEGRCRIAISLSDLWNSRSVEQRRYLAGKQIETYDFQLDLIDIDAVLADATARKNLRIIFSPADISSDFLLSAVAERIGSATFGKADTPDRKDLIRRLAVVYTFVWNNLTLEQRESLFSEEGSTGGVRGFVLVGGSSYRKAQMPPAPANPTEYTIDLTRAQDALNEGHDHYLHGRYTEAVASLTVGIDGYRGAVQSWESVGDSNGAALMGITLRYALLYRESAKMALGAEFDWNTYKSLIRQLNADIETFRQIKMGDTYSVLHILNYIQGIVAIITSPNIMNNLPVGSLERRDVIEDAYRFARFIAERLETIPEADRNTDNFNRLKEQLRTQLEILTFQMFSGLGRQSENPE